MRLYVSIIILTLSFPLPGQYNMLVDKSGKAVVMNERTTDPIAQRFIQVAGITDPTEIQAINELAIGLKQDNTWSKLVAIHPIVGGTEQAHKFNLKNPIDSDQAYRLTFANSPAHSDSGVSGNGSNQFVNTHINCSKIGGYNNLSFGIEYKWQAIHESYLGVIDGENDRITVLEVSTSLICDVPGFANRIAPPLTDSTGLYQFHTHNQRTYILRNGSALGNSGVLTSVPMPTSDFYFLARNFGGISGATEATVSFFYYGIGLTPEENAAIESRINDFQTKLGRNTY